MAKNEEMLGVTFGNDNGLPYVDSDNSLFYIPFYKTEEYFEIYENYCTFVKACEAMVRKSKFYKVYIKYLIEIVGMNCCQVLPNVEVDDSKGVTIEMHHGPILTLFDICSIVLDHLRKSGDKYITTFKVADIVLEEHRLNNVRVILLSKTVHQEVHNENIMLNYRMGFGDTSTFLEKYKLGIDKNMRKKINEYIKWSLENDSCDNNVLEVADKMKVWGNNDIWDFDISPNKELLAL